MRSTSFRFPRVFTKSRRKSRCSLGRRANSFKAKRPLKPQPRGVPGTQEGGPQKGEQEEGVGPEEEARPKKAPQPLVQKEVEGEEKPAQDHRNLLGVRAQRAPEVAEGPGHAARKPQGGRHVPHPEVTPLKPPQAPKGAAATARSGARRSLRSWRAHIAPAPTPTLRAR